MACETGRSKFLVSGNLFPRCFLSVVEVSTNIIFLIHESSHSQFFLELVINNLKKSKDKRGERESKKIDKENLSFSYLFFSSSCFSFSLNVNLSSWINRVSFLDTSINIHYYASCLYYSCTISCLQLAGTLKLTSKLLIRSKWEKYSKQLGKGKRNLINISFSLNLFSTFLEHFLVRLKRQ